MSESPGMETVACSWYREIEERGKSAVKRRSEPVIFGGIIEAAFDECSVESMNSRAAQS